MAETANMKVVVSMVDEISAKLSGVQKKLKDLGDAGEKTSTGVAGASSMLSKMAPALFAVGAGAGTAGAAIGLMGVKAAGAFEKQMSSIEALTGATDDQLKSVQDLSLMLGKETSFSALEAAQGIEELLKAGVKLDDIMSGAARGALDLAAAGNISVAESAEIASTALNAFKDDGISVTRAADILAGSANASATSVQEMRFSLQAVSAVAAGIGLTFEDTSTAIAAFAQNGLKGSDAGTSLKTMLMNLQPVTDKQIALFQDLGIVTEDGANQFFTASGEIKSMAEIAGVLQDSMKEMTDQERAMALEIMFGSDAIRAGNILFKEGSDGINKMQEDLNKFTAADVAAKRIDNLYGAIDLLKANIETQFIVVFQQLLPVITDVTNKIANFIGAIDFAGAIENIKTFYNETTQNLTNLWTNVQNFWTKWGEAITIAVTTITGFFLPWIVKMTITTGIELGKQLALWTWYLTGLTTQWAIASAKSLIAAGKVAASWVIAMGPISILTALIAGLTYLVIKHWDEIKLATKMLVESMKSFFGMLGESWKLLWDNIGGIVSGAWDGIKSGISDGINWVLSKINGFISKFNGMTQSLNGIPGIDIPSIPEIPMLAKGGIVTRPTLAMIGEAGPEAVVPLSKYNGEGGKTVTFNVYQNGDNNADFIARLNLMAKMI